MLPITVVLTQNYSDWEIAPLTGLGGAFFGADIRYVSPSGGALQSVAGLSIADTATFVEQSEGVIVVCGSPIWESEDAPAINAALANSFENGCVIAGICGGTAALARAGLLDNVRHTSNGASYLGDLVPAYAGGAHYVDQPMALRDGKIITAAAPAPVSFAYEVLAAAGLPDEQAQQIRHMLALEHHR